MKNFLYIPLAVAALTACDGSDTATAVQHPDGYDYILLSAQPQTVVTRANAYEGYDETRHPATMGVMGYYDIASYNDLNTQSTVSTPNPVFGNATMTYNATATNRWTYSPLKKWDDYKGATAFDFFAYMPQRDGSTVTRTTEDDNSYTLSIPFAMPDGDCAITDQRLAPIICNLPEHKEGTTAEGDEFTFDRMVTMKFDQTLTAYRLLFRLDARMGAMRQFRIKGVSISGSAATAGTVSRTYHWKDSEWTADDIVWSITSRLADGAKTTIPNAADANGDNTLLMPTTEYAQWGGTFYVIPDASFQPVIAVKYDVEFVDQDGKTVVTRKDVTSTIELNKNNFASLASGGIAMVNPIRILVQPRYLYVMADQDAYTGYLLVE